jgi:hypothetical protein
VYSLVYEQVMPPGCTSRPSGAAPEISRCCVRTESSVRCSEALTGALLIRHSSTPLCVMGEEILQDATEASLAALRRRLRDCQDFHIMAQLLLIVGQQARSCKRWRAELPCCRRIVRCGELEVGALAKARSAARAPLRQQ